MLSFAPCFVVEVQGLLVGNGMSLVYIGLAVSDITTQIPLRFRCVLGITKDNFDFIPEQPTTTATRPRNITTADVRWPRYMRQSRPGHRYTKTSRSSHQDLQRPELSRSQIAPQSSPHINRRRQSRQKPTHGSRHRTSSRPSPVKSPLGSNTGGL